MADKTKKTTIVSDDPISKRDLFAALMLQALLSNASGIKEPEHWVRYAVEYADALLIELKKE